MERIYHPYNIWEDYLNGMWRKVDKEQEQEMLEKAIEFTGDHVLYGKYMKDVIFKWRIACEHNLTNKSINRKAWLGHSAVCLATGIPEYITRRAWHFLTEEQQDNANAQADNAIKTWEKIHESRIRN